MVVHCVLDDKCVVAKDCVTTKRNVTRRFDSVKTMRRLEPLKVVRHQAHQRDGCAKKFRGKARNTIKPLF